MTNRKTILLLLTLGITSLFLSTGNDLLFYQWNILENSIDLEFEEISEEVDRPNFSKRNTIDFGDDYCEEKIIKLGFTKFKCQSEKAIRVCSKKSSLRSLVILFCCLKLFCWVKCFILSSLFFRETMLLSNLFNSISTIKWWILDFKNR